MHVYQIPNEMDFCLADASPGKVVLGSRGTDVC